MEEENVKNSKLAEGRRGVGGGGRSMTNRKRSMYNLKLHSAFKLLTMAAGYKVFCRWPDSPMRSGVVRGEGVESSAIQKFDLFERRLRTARGRGRRIRPDSATDEREREREREREGE